MGAREDLSRLEDAVAEILELPEDQQAAAFASLRAAHPDYERLILRWEEGVRLVDSGPPTTTQVYSVPESVGPYRIGQVLGQGGMGTVYLAEQDQPVQRQVAVKVIKLGMDSAAILRRFELERQALALMNHDAIAKVYDAGATERGQPYFAMEYVEGLPLTKYCDQQRLDLEQRIRLMQRICEGVQHAHQKGVIHRDLKPSNILVREADGVPMPKIIDFGLARATDPEQMRQSLMTQYGVVVGTPQYMAPEQADPGSVHVDTRTDVYSLGVILYELLAGTLPDDEVSSATTETRLRQVLERDTPRPSAKLAAAGESSTEIAAARATSPTSLVRVLRDDLDWVVLRAMERKPDRRYGSAAELSQELERYLTYQPLIAGPPSTGYRLRKLLRRYRGQVLAGGLVAGALIAGTVTSTVFALEADENAREAFEQQEIAVRQADLATTRAEQIAEEQARTREALDRFGMLRYRIEFDATVAAAGVLYPAWPERVADFEGWLQGPATELRAALPSLREARDGLRARALPARPEDGASRAPGELSQVALLESELRSLQAGLAVREGQAAVTEVDVDPELAALSAVELIQMGSPWITLDPATRVFGREREALAMSRLVVEKVHGGDPSADLPAALMFLCLSHLALGQDADAERVLEEHMELATAADRELFEARREIVRKHSASLQPEPLRQRIDRLEWRLSAARDAVADARPWRFADSADQFLHGTLVDLIAELVAFEDPEEGLPVDVAQRLRWAREIERLSIDDHLDRWDEAAAAIAAADGVVASELYGRAPIALEPQVGLVPIGPNPETGLWEFYHLRSAWDGESDPAAITIPEHADDGSLSVDEGTGIVFVLVPGGTFVMGAQNRDPSGVNYDPLAKHDEVPREVTLAPFFLARHEITQAQYRRLGTGDNPSFYYAERMVGNRQVLWSNPVEQLSWNEASKLVTRHGLDLPTEAQWEYACRAGTDTPWWTGAERESLVRGGAAANLADRTAARIGLQWPALSDWPELDDGYAVHAPVDTLRPNPWGFHHMIGNVMEWCRDGFTAPTTPNRPGDGLREGGSHPDRMHRGGSYANAVYNARVSKRTSSRPDNTNDYFGARVARALR